MSDNLENIELFSHALARGECRYGDLLLLTWHEGRASRRNLQISEGFGKKDIMANAVKGALAGAVLASVIVLVSVLTGFSASSGGWAVVIYASLIAFGFCTWEGTLIGLHRFNPQYRRFRRLLQQGIHVCRVDVDERSLTTVQEQASRCGLNTVSIDRPAFQGLRMLKLKLAD